jgi:hypothetical protein
MISKLFDCVKLFVSAPKNLIFQVHEAGASPNTRPQKADVALPVVSP